MTATMNPNPDTADAAETAERPGDRLDAVDIGRVIDNPHNVRIDLGDLADLTRSIKNNGVLIPVLVLPADDDGNHVLVAGHRRRAAAKAAGRDHLPVIIRHLTPVEILDTMLTENEQRSDLSMLEQITAVARYQVLAPNETPTAIGKRIGRTVKWVKDRFAVAALPADVLARVGNDLPLAAAVAIGSIVERGDDVVRKCADHVVDRRHYHDDPAAAVEQFIISHDANLERARIAQKLLDAGVTVYASSHEARTAGAVPLEGQPGGSSLSLDAAAARKHRNEACHAEVISVPLNGKITRTAHCANPKRHRGTQATPAESAIVSENPNRASSNTANGAAQKAREKQNRQDRKDRVEAVTAALSRRVPKVETQRLAALVLIDGLDQAGRKLAAQLLGVDSPGDDDYHAAERAMTEWLDTHPDPTALLAALAIGHLESRGTKSSPLTDYGQAGEARIATYNTWREAHTK